MSDIRVLEAKDPCFKQIGIIKFGLPCSAFGISHKYGVTCIALENHLHLIHTEELLKENADDLIKTKIPCHTLACNEEMIAVGFGDNVIFYPYSALVQDVPKPLSNLKAKSNVKKLLFNPTDNTMLAILSDDGNVLLTKMHTTGSGFQNWAYNDNKVTTFCFSPKGKQLCVGHESGDFTQLKLDLTLAKKIRGPGGVPVSLLWISTSQFLALMLANSQDNLSLFQIDVQKAPSPPTYVDFGDVFISDEINASSHCWFNMINESIVCSSSTSSDVVVILKNTNGWNVADDIEDRRRAALPIDNFSVGGSFYFNYEENVSFTDSEVYGPMPVLVIGSQDGAFSVFSFVNKGGLGENVNFKENMCVLTWRKTTGSDNQVLLPDKFQKPLDMSQPFALSGQQNQQSSFLGQPPTSSFSFAVPSPQPAANPPTSSALYSLLSSPPIIATPKPTVASTPAPTSTGIFSHATAASGDTKPENFLSFGQPSSLSAFAGFGSGESAQSADSQARKQSSQLPIRLELEKVKTALSQGEVTDDLIAQFVDFEKKMEKHRKLCSDHYEKLNIEEARLADYFENNVLSALNELEDFVENTQETIKIQKADENYLLQRSMSQYGQLSYALALDERNRDPKYLELLKTMPMDPATTRRIRDLEKALSFMKSQIQECRRHFYFARCPPLTPKATAKFILTTVQNHGIVIKNLFSECDTLREKLKLRPGTCIDDLVDGLQKTSLTDSKLSINAEDMETLRCYARRKNIIKLKTSVNADYNYSDGVLTNREGLGEGSYVKSVLTMISSDKKNELSKITSTTGTQTESLISGLSKVTMTDFDQQGEISPKPVKPSSDLRSDSYTLKGFAPLKEAGLATDTRSTFSPGMAMAQPFKSKPEPAKENLQQVEKSLPTSKLVTTHNEPSISQPVSFQPFSASTTDSKGFQNPGSLFSFKPADSSSSIFGSGINFSATAPKPGATFVFKPASSVSDSKVQETEVSKPGTALLGAQPVDLSGSGFSVDEAKTPESSPFKLNLASTKPSTDENNTSNEPFKTIPSFTSSFLGTTLGAANDSSFQSVPATVKPLATSAGNLSGGAFSFQFNAASTTESVSSEVGSGIFSSPKADAPSTSSAQQGITKSESPTATTFGEGFNTGIEPISPVSTTSSSQVPKPEPPQLDLSSPNLFASLSTSSNEPKQVEPFGKVDSSKPSASSSPFSFKIDAFTSPVPTSTSTTSPFGSNLFGSTPFSANTTAMGGSIFGSALQSSPSTFGQTSPLQGSAFGAAQLTESSQKPTFGGAPIFGGATPFGATSTFSTSSATPPTTSVFGSSITGTSFAQFAQPAGGAFGATSGDTQQKPMFGGPPVFGGGTFGSSTFSSSSPPTGSVFGSNVQGSSFSQFAQQPSTGFGAPSTGSQSTAFGAPSVFGGTPFGATATPFSSNTSSPGSIFGGVNQQASFGQFAQQQPIGFGSGTPLGSEPQKPASFGGNSFSSWR